MTRTLIVGDVHGCLSELNDLLAAVAFGNDDSVVFVGDLVGRGPDTLGVLDLVKRLSARSVQGNHERKLLEAYEGECRGTEPVKLGAGHRQLMKDMKPEHWAIMKAMPLYLPLLHHQVCIVHAGILQGVPIFAQDPWVLTHIRSLDERGRPSSQLGKESWAAAYKGPPHIVFGHSAQGGLQLHEHATGLDSGCVYGRHLTGLLLNEGQLVPELANRKHSLVSVAARRTYYQPPS